MGDILWEQLWSHPDGEILTLQCAMADKAMHFFVWREDGTCETDFTDYEQAVAWLKTEGFANDLGDSSDAKPTRHLSPQERKRLNYQRETRVLPTGRGMSRRLREKFPKLRRRQLRHRMKAFLRREANTLFREVSDQSFRSFRADDIPDAGEEMPLGKAIQEKQRRRKEGIKTTRVFDPMQEIENASRTRARHNRDSNGDDLPDWLKPYS